MQFLLVIQQQSLFLGDVVKGCAAQGNIGEKEEMLRRNFLVQSQSLAHIFGSFQGRADDLIKVSGQWVWPLEVERCLNEHPDVHECAVLAHQLEDKRMALRAVVSLVPGVAADDAKTRELRDYVKSQLTPFKSPRLFEYLAELPKTGTGKIDRQAIVNMPVADTA